MKFKFCSNCCKIHTNSVAVKIDNVFTSSYCEKNRNHLVMHICEKVRCNLPVCFEGKNPIKRSLQLPTEKKNREITTSEIMDVFKYYTLYLMFNKDSSHSFFAYIAITFIW